MCAYNSVDGSPACANHDLLQQTSSASEWGFQGYVVSDCGAIDDIFRGHNTCTNAAEAAAAAVKAGTDLTCGTEYRTLPDAVKQGLITEDEIDEAISSAVHGAYSASACSIRRHKVPFSSIGTDQIA